MGETITVAGVRLEKSHVVDANTFHFDEGELRAVAQEVYTAAKKVPKPFGANIATWSQADQENWLQRKSRSYAQGLIRDALHEQYLRSIGRDDASELDKARAAGELADQPGDDDLDDEMRKAVFGG